jgi:CheY-like chemotaxis protein
MPILQLVPQEPFLPSNCQEEITNYKKYMIKNTEMEKGRKTILIVDDDLDYLFQTRMYVESFGFDALTAENEQEAEEIIARMKPDLAILDLMMEKEDSGFILCYKIKKKYPDLPIIVATAVAFETGMSFGLNSESDKKWIKADLYLEKGIRADQLQKEINKLLKI